MLSRMLEGLPADLVPAGVTWPVVLGFDPGTRCAGYGAIVVAPRGPRLLACGTLEARRGSAALRLAYIAEAFAGLLARLRPSVEALEGAFAARNVQSALRIGEARGIVRAGAARRGIEVDEIAPASAKRAVVGHGGASKVQVAAMVATLLGAELATPLDATDALALALAHLRRRSLAGLRERLSS